MKKKINFRSKLEERTSEQLKSINWLYEGEQLNYSIPITHHKYTPDFVITKPDGRKLFLECKGRHRWGGMDLETRKKMEYVKQQNPNLDIRFVFDKANNKIGTSPKSMTWEQWAEKMGYKYTINIIPIEWFK